VWLGACERRSDKPRDRRLPGPRRTAEEKGRRNRPLSEHPLERLRHMRLTKDVSESTRSVERGEIARRSDRAASARAERSFRVHVLGTGRAGTVWTRATPGVRHTAHWILRRNVSGSARKSDKTLAPIHIRSPTASVPVSGPQNVFNHRDLPDIRAHGSAQDLATVP
jgi:hypothetical protein